MNKFTGKTVIITGSSRGIGKATAIMFAKEGANIVVNYVNSSVQANELVNEIKSIGSSAIAIRCDVASEVDIQNMVNESILKFGKIDILINNAGYAKFIPILERNADDWRKTLDINLIGQFLCIKYVSKNMLENGSGRIVNISSTSGIHNFDHSIADYDAAKAGVITLTKNFAKALAPNIFVNSVAPGWVNTDMNADLTSNFIENENSQIYTKRFAQPEEIAKAVLFLASDDASYITGSVLVVDGGHD